MRNNAGNAERTGNKNKQNEKMEKMMSFL